MNTSNLSPTDRRRRRERLGVTVILMLVVFFGLLEGWFFRFKADLPLFGNILLFALINLNVILLLLLAYLVLRNIVKLIFERKRNILGHQLRTRLVIAFVGLAIIPTLPLFWLATHFISFSLDYWFSHQVEQSLEQGVALSKSYLEEKEKGLALDCKLLREELSNLLRDSESSHSQSKPISPSLLFPYHLDGIFFFDDRGKMIWQWQNQKTPLTLTDLEQLKSFSLEESRIFPVTRSISLEGRREGLIAYIPFPIPDDSSSEKVLRLIILRLFPPGVAQKMSAITSGYEDYLQLKLLRNPFKTSHIITFSIVTLLVIFAAIWFGFFLAKNITVPVQNLVTATRRVAEGDLDVRLNWERQDELGMLITSFNKMVGDLQEGRQQLAGAYQALQQSHQELEDRRRYMEIVLRNIAAGVVSVDSQGRIMTINKSAEAMFGLQGEQVLGLLYSEFLQPGQMEIAFSFMDMYRQNRQSHLERQVQVMIGNRPMVLLIKVSVLQDEQSQCLGAVIVFDDLTDLEKAQRMAAWREVARRIAHEIKNPLTPIQLSAQRLRRRYSDLLSDAQGSLLEECTRTIIQQVESMKHLVNEFSNFARLPRARPVPCNLTTVVEESLALYRHTHPHLSLLLKKDSNFPLLNLDREQFQQVMINLLENAIHASDGQEGTIEVRLSYDSILKIAKLECLDTGHGLSPEDKLRIFEPYYSTKEKGTGLGLAIVAGIVADHNGFLRVRDNTPRGTVMTIELPG